MRINLFTNNVTHSNIETKKYGLILLARSVYGNRIVKIKPELLLEQKYQTIVEGFFFSFTDMKKTKTEMLYSRSIRSLDCNKKQH